MQETGKTEKMIINDRAMLWKRERTLKKGG